MQVLAALFVILLALNSTHVAAGEPTLVLDPRSDIPSGPFEYELLDALRPVTANLVRQMNECIEGENEGGPLRIRVLVALDENGAVTDVRPHPEMPPGNTAQLKSATKAVSECGPFDNGGHPDVYRLLDIVLVDDGP